MQHLEVSGAVRPLQSSLGVKRLTGCCGSMLPQQHVNIKELICEWFEMNLARNNVAP